MGVTKINELNTAQSRVYLANRLPATAADYHGAASNDVDSVEWKGGEIAYNTTDNKFYINTATSGASPTWRSFFDATTAA